ncbi:rRNA pseudouridine synthase [Candidatus Woesearchaeota archaeon]|nr:rRNA pseudouridine synthase [Candidatus Woesearchaeota archaeon]MBW2978659.1 rRNA pseudouridine synthase [Candidatus Woesearchaeota archaeon]
MERIQKIMAQAGIASRRKCEEIIQEGRVKVNGRTAKIGDSASSTDKITLDNKPLKKQEKIYIILNKPIGFVTTVSEKHGMKTVMKLIKLKERLFPVGRLDKNTEGLLLITNDGELANKLIHPSHKVWKKYEAWLSRPFKDIEKLKKGVVVDKVKTNVKIKNVQGKKVIISIHEGRKHIVRKMFGKLGYNVTKLRRTQIGPLKLRKLAKGTWRYLKKYELRGLTGK